MLFRLIPLPARSGAYGRARLLGDLSGGIIAALIALPYGLAMASLMGLPPVLGLFASIISAPFIAFFGRNPVLIGGASSVTVPFIAQAMHTHGAGGAALLVILSSLIMVGLSFAHAGRHIMRVPHAVVSGFTCGIGLLMIASQLHTLLGIAPPENAGFVSPAESVYSVLTHLGAAQWQPLVVGLVAVVVSAISARLSPYVPAPLIGVLAAILVAHLIPMQQKEVGTLPAGLPPLFAFSWGIAPVLQLLPSAIGLAFVASVNILITARVIEHFRGRHHAMTPGDADAELRAFGIANIASGLIGAPPSVGMPARSVAVVKCGGTTALANLYHAATLVIILWLGSAFVSHIPLPALGGITVWMSFSLLHWGTWRRLHKMRKRDAWAFVLTSLAVLVVNSVVALLIGCAVYLVPKLFGRSSNAAKAPEPVSPAESEAELVDSAAD